MIGIVLNTAIKDIEMYYDANNKLKNNKSFASNLIKLSLNIETLKQMLALHGYIYHVLSHGRFLSQEGKASLLELLDGCGEKVDGRYLDAVYVAQFERELKKIDQFQKTNWKSTAQKHAADVPDSLRNMSALLENPEAADIVQELIRTLQNRWPISQKEIDLFMAKVKEGQSFLAALKIDDQDIADFITKLRLRQATVADLNDNVLSWIRNYHLESRIKMSFGA